MHESLFDRHAASYDQQFTTTRTARYLREQVQSRLLQMIPPKADVLEIGCGTGEDALFLAQNGMNVTATDASHEMLSVAKTKASNSQTNIKFEILDLHSLPAWKERSFDAVFANFGVLNVLERYDHWAAWLSERIRPGGYAAFAVMGRFCLFESIWHVLHGNFVIAARRWRGQSTFDGTRITYPTPYQLEKALDISFRRTHLSGLGCFVPTSDATGAIEKHPRLWATLKSADRIATHLPHLSDHYWIEFQRRQ